MPHLLILPDIRLWQTTLSKLITTGNKKEKDPWLTPKNLVRSFGNNCSLSVAQARAYIINHATLQLMNSPDVCIERINFPRRAVEKVPKNKYVGPPN